MNNAIKVWAGVARRVFMMIAGSAIVAAAIIILLAPLSQAKAAPVTVSVVPGSGVGLDDALYFAGLVTLDIDGVQYPAMATKWNLTSIIDPRTISGSWNTNMYSRDDILAGGTNVSWSAEKYSYAAVALWFALTTTELTNEPLWFAGHNEVVWEVTNDFHPWEYAKRVYDTVDGIDITIHDAYTLVYTDYMDPNRDYSDFMQVVAPGGGQNHEFIVFTAPVPIPPAVWLFGSALLGLVGIARRRRAS